MKNTITKMKKPLELLSTLLSWEVKNECALWITWSKNQLSVPIWLSGCERACVLRRFSHVRFFETPWTAAHQASLSLTNSWSLLKLNVHRVGEVIQPSHPLSSPLLLLPSIFPSISIFSNESALRIKLSKFWSFSFSISPSMNIQD